MERTREDLQDQVIALLHAGRELSPAEDEALADAFVSHLEHLTRRQSRHVGQARVLYGAVAALAVLLAIPVVMVIETYSNLDGYLPSPDASALPLVYWMALAVVLAVLVLRLVNQRVGWQVQVTARRRPAR